MVVFSFIVFAIVEDLIEVCNLRRTTFICVQLNTREAATEVRRSDTELSVRQGKTCTPSLDAASIKEVRL